MEDELMNLENLERVLTEFAEDVKQNYATLLQTHDHVYTGRLMENITVHVDRGDNEYVVSFDMEHYWKYLEEGVRGAANPSSPYRNPGWKAYPHILKWVQLKPVIPRPDGNGRIPSEKSLAYLITRSIVENGTQPTLSLETARERTLDWWRDRISDALGRDFENYIAKILP